MSLLLKTQRKTPKVLSLLPNNHNNIIIKKSNTQLTVISKLRVLFLKR